ncbi:IQ motif and SEC7 domain-containing protein 3-like [Gorilla gorilla gorilla]|uniref:IQ motif and SEC7 domain-containing protein 3-like n=1 Tax=Gorilla gorilla gorilla TaxID=9595 RepID=UPI0024463241|nr:IQ motif and SEC7 domain-containing protein 3-like [Gorilla gorilla gorilla]
MGSAVDKLPSFILYKRNFAKKSDSPSFSGRLRYPASLPRLDTGSLSLASSLSSLPSGRQSLLWTPRDRKGEAGPVGEDRWAAGFPRPRAPRRQPRGRQGAGGGGWHREPAGEPGARAVLYLKGSGPPIVQNQQSLVHIQRQRIDEQERRLDELSAENRSLWEHQRLLLQAHPCARHRRSRYWPSGPLLSPLPLGARNLSRTRDSAHPPRHTPRPSRRRLSTTDSSWRGPSLLAAGLIQPKRPTSSRDTWGRYLQVEGGFTELLRCSRSLSSVQMPRALGKGVLSRRPE